MAKPEWGIKRICLSCGAKFYDFDKTPIICPKCSAEFDPEALLRARRGRSDKTKEREAPKPAAKKDDEAPELENEDDIEDIEDDDSDDDSVIESTDDLDDDDDDVAGVGGGGEKEEDS